ncbi:Disease resistance protein [Artemisia annua]|uniref:Disease resistance protein n=1 Tax=Artemisia annua TaxID=35608 RepID=A0A2U1QKQ0_ARTAN|nr:Disease resistance protein [Artemisia annua]
MTDAEVLLTVTMPVLFQKLKSDNVIRIARSVGIHSQLKRLERTLLQFQLTDVAVNYWEHSLEDLAYDIDYLLSDLATEAIRQQCEKESYASNNKKKKVLMTIPTAVANATHNLAHARNMSVKLDMITTKLHDLLEETYRLGQSAHNVSTSLFDESRIIVGRRHDKDVLLVKYLLNNETSATNISVLSIVGMAGVGKTTLAMLLFNDPQMKHHFDLMAWVTVSLQFDAFQISQTIFQSVSGENKEFADLNILQIALRDRLSRKRFLLVLDNVWIDRCEDWEVLLRPFVAVAPGSRVIVTTRDTYTASITDPDQGYPLNPLAPNEALHLLALFAQVNLYSNPTLTLMGEIIAKKCHGVPMALKTVGRILRTKKRKADWVALINSDMWYSNRGGNISSALDQYYNYLRPIVKKMFFYCSLFPKGYVFHKDKLVLLWMAEGFLHQSDESESMESLGCKYFEELKSRSIFNHSPNDDSRCTMHDLLNDLAKSVAGQFFFMLDDERDVSDNIEALEKFHHFSFVRQQFGVYSKFKALQEARRLQTFIAISSNVDDCKSFHISEKVLLELVPQLQFLRVLSLSNYSITKIPQSIGSLKHMRYMNFSKTSITHLPEQISDLYNLQILLLHGCKKLVSMPKSFANLVNLRHLDIDDTPMLKKLPLGIDGLTGLKTLSKVIIERSNGFKLSKLRGMKDLRGRLSIEGLHKVKDARQAEEANLQQKKGLDDLVMEWSDVFDDSRNEVNEYEVLEKLKIHHELIRLKILFYGGTKFPSWVGDSSCFRLTQLTLRGCQNCTCLPTLGFLKSLKKLFVERMPKVENIGSHLSPSLEVLEFEDMQGWKIWSINNGDSDESKTSFPHLSEISIVDCPELAQVSVGKMPSLRVIRIGRCSKVVLRSMVGASSSVISLKMDNINGLTPLHGEVLQHLGVVEHLCITKCHTMEYLWESKSEAPKYLANLQKLEVSSCKKLASLGKTADDNGITMENLTEVSLTNCEKLQSYKCPQSIKRLVIHNCQSIKELSFPPRQNLPLILDIQRCHSLKEFWPDKNSLSSVNSLEMDNLPNLRSFPEECFESLAKLIIRGCDNIDTIPEKVFDNIPLCHLEIISCKNMKSFPHKLLPRLTLLKELLITNCPHMDSFPCRSWPPNISILRIGRLRKPMSKWGLQAFPDSLVNLCLLGENSGVDSFARVPDERNNHHTTSSSAFVLPSSLIILEIIGFRLLGSLSEGFEHLKSLEQLVIESCPNLGDLPESLLPSLSSLKVSSSLNLQERCRSKKGYRHLISHIPEVDV